MFIRLDNQNIFRYISLSDAKKINKEENTNILYPIVRGASFPSTEVFYPVSRKEEGLRDVTRVMEAVL